MVNLEYQFEEWLWVNEDWQPVIKEGVRGNEEGNERNVVEE